MSSDTVPSDAPAGARGRGAAAVAGAVLLAVSLAAALSIDVVRTGYGVKSDEATYVMMALSAAYDHDLTYQHRDLERFWQIYGSGPEGLFLKRGKVLHVALRRRPPFVDVSRAPDPRADRLYFGKAFIYPVAAAPFVRLAGLNGLLAFHVLLLFGVCVCGYTFLAARSRPGPALLFTLAFLGASVVPIYAVFLMPETFNFALVFYAYFLWAYKEAAPQGRWAMLRGRISDIAAAVLLGLATYSKPTNALMIAPLVLLLWWRRRYAAGFVVGTAFVATTAALFLITAMSSGEFNYQGGDRKTFYRVFPFESASATWNATGIQMTTNDADTEHVLAPSELANRFGHNVEYFALGRHFGFLPYSFPGVVALVLWVLSRERSDAWRLLTFGAVAASAVALLLFAPYTWSGGGGPPGNRYFLSLYGPLFFLTPPLFSTGPGLAAWIGGALFTAKVLVNPFYSAKATYTIAEQGPARLLPVELTMANDLPIMLDRSRAHLLYGDSPQSSVLLYFLDEHAYTPEPGGFMWVSGRGRADIVVRAAEPVRALRMTVSSPIRTTFTASAGAASMRIPLVPGQARTFDLPVAWVRGDTGYAWLLSAQSSAGFVPRLRDPNSSDGRNLGVQVRFTPVS